jgi:RNA-binding protein YlmH
MDKGKLLDRVGGEKEDRLALARVLDRAEQAQNRNIPAGTDFLTPQQLLLALDLLRQAGVPEDRFLRMGGYDGAERAILLFLPDWLEAEDAADQSPLRCLRAAYRAEEKLTHRDLLGSLMGLGIVREKVGDILVGPDSADLIVLDTVEAFLLQNWCSAGRARLTVTELDPRHLHIPAAKWEEVRDTVSALRLDAVASTGFKMARGKAAALIESGRVQVNWRECTKPDKLLTAGDTVSARGFGKFELTEVGGVTRKGRTSIVLKRYV